MRVNKDIKYKTIKPNHMLTNIYSVDDIRTLHQKYFFSRDTMRFFASRLISEVFPTDKGGVYFVTSEKTSFTNTTRVYNVRRYDIKGDYMTTIETLDSRARALTSALDLAYSDTILNEVKHA